MWFEHPVPAPERLPNVPMRLGDCVRAYRSGAVRIDLHVRAGKGWRKLDALHLEDGDEHVDPRAIAGWVTACAEHHAVLADAPGKYRAMVWRYFGGELERRKAAFDVTLPCPAPPPTPPRPQRRPEQPRPRARSPRDLRRTVLETRMMLDEILAHPGGLSIDPFAALRPEPEPLLERVHREMAEMAALYDEGERSGTVDGLELAETRILWKLALLRGQDDGDLWTEIAPTIEAGLAKLRRDAVATLQGTSDHQPTNAANACAGAPSSSPGTEPDAERTEGAPPSSDDAPPARKDGLVSSIAALGG